MNSEALVWCQEVLTQCTSSILQYLHCVNILTAGLDGRQNTFFFSIVYSSVKHLHIFFSKFYFDIHVQEQKRCCPAIKTSDPTTGYSSPFCRGKL